MTHPVQKNQNISSQNSIPPALPTFNPQSPLFRDTLKMGTLAQNASIFRQFWDAIVNFFKSIFGCFFKVDSPSSSINTALDTKAKIREIAARDNFVWFYKAEQNPLTAFMGNFHPCTIRLWGMEFKCAEAAFQAAKFYPNRAQMETFQNLDGPTACQNGRQLSRTWGPHETAAWHNRSIAVMREVVNAKFNQNPDLKELLLATGHAYLVEHIPVKGRDAFWGDDFDGTGLNWLGGIAMEMRGNVGGEGPVVRSARYNQFVSRP